MTAPPSAVAGWPLGVDLYSGNAADAAAIKNLHDRGKNFAITKSSQGTAPDARFDDYYRWIRESRLIRGSYHFFANKHSASGGSVADQANAVLARVTRLLPGDLAPALDLEDEPRNPASGGPLGASQGGRFPLDQGLHPAEQGYGYRHGAHPNWQDGRDELLADIQDFLNRIETALGRTPIIYTSIMWRDSDMMNNPTVMSQYPLWTVYHGEASLADIAVGAWGSNWDVVQYAEAGGKWWGVDPYAEAGINIGGLDFDAYHGTIYGLRGLADIGRPSVALDGTTSYLVHAEADGSLHLLTGPSWTESQSTLVSRADLVGGDPALLVSAGTVFLYYRSGDHLVEATATPAASQDWQTNPIEDAAPLHDPRAVMSGSGRHVVYWGADDDWYLLNWDNAWSTSGGILSVAGVKTSATQGQSTGQPILYFAQGAVHVAGRAGAEGHLVDLCLEDGQWKADDVTALARSAAPDLPAATYSPGAYETSAGSAIVFRAVGGDLWVVTRSDNAPTNLTNAAPGAKPVAGHPACFVLNDEPHIVYRGIDRIIYDISFHDGAWHAQQICTEPAAADPVATSDGTVGLVSMRAMTGLMHGALFDGTTWTCTPITP